MNFGLRWQTPSLGGARPLLRWSQHLFFAIGTLALGHCGFVLLDARFFQTYQSWQFQRALKDSNSSAGRSTHDQTAQLFPTLTGSNRLRDEYANQGAAGGSSLGRIE